jgi:hypothetical protein
MEWWRSKIWIACVNRRAARQQHVCQRRTAVILQRTEQRVGIDLIARAIQITAAIVAADVISMRRHCAAVIEDILPRRAGVEN